MRAASCATSVCCNYNHDFSCGPAFVTDTTEHPRRLMPRVPGLWYIRPYKSTERSTCPSVVKHHPSAVRHGAPAGDEHSSIFSQPCGCSPAPLCSDLHCSQSSPTSRRDKEEEAGPQPSLSGFRCPHILTLGWKTNLLLSATVALLPARGLLRVAGRHWAD